MKNYLNFETEVKNLEAELDQLKDPYNQEGLSEVDTSKISKVQKEIDEKLSEIYSNLDPWQTALVARHEDRPKAKFFIDNLFEDLDGPIKRVAAQDCHVPYNEELEAEVLPQTDQIVEAINNLSEF